MRGRLVLGAFAFRTVGALIGTIIPEIVVAVARLWITERAGDSLSDDERAHPVFGRPAGGADRVERFVQ